MRADAALSSLIDFNTPKPPAQPFSSFQESTAYVVEPLLLRKDGELGYAEGAQEVGWGDWSTRGHVYAVRCYLSFVFCCFSSMAIIGAPVGVTSRQLCYCGRPCSAFLYSARSSACTHVWVDLGAYTIVPPQSSTL